MSTVYVTADIRPGHDLCVDVTALGLRSGSIDLVVAVHVLEHVGDDRAAIFELARIMAPGGTAIVAVPVVADQTVEYHDANAREHDHVRAPGVDWYDRLHDAFPHVALVSSDDVPAEFQTYLYEDRTKFPNRTAPERPPQAGARHSDFVAFARL